MVTFNVLLSRSAMNGMAPVPQHLYWTPSGSYPLQSVALHRDIYWQTPYRAPCRHTLLIVCEHMKKGCEPRLWNSFTLSEGFLAPSFFFFSFFLLTPRDVSDVDEYFVEGYFATMSPSTEILTETLCSTDPYTVWYCLIHTLAHVGTTDDVYFMAVLPYFLQSSPIHFVTLPRPLYNTV